MGVFADFDMPLFYPLGVKQEHLHVRAKAGLFDISHMVHVEVSGADAAALVARLCPYDAAEQKFGECKYTFFLNDKAGIIDDLIVTRLGDERYLIVCNAGCAEKDVEHIRQVAKKLKTEVDVIERGFLALQGPEAESVMVRAGFDVANLEFMSGYEPKSGWFVSRTGYTGEDGFEIAMPVGETVGLSEQFITDPSVEWIGLGARDSLRLEAGLSLYGNDLDEQTTPHEAGLIWAIPKTLREGASYIGADALTAAMGAGRKRMRVALLPEGRPVRGGTEIVNDAGDHVGTITSGGFGPSLDAPMSIGFVTLTAADKPLFADMRGKKIPLQRAKLPFVPHRYKR